MALTSLLSASLRPFLVHREMEPLMSRLKKMADKFEASTNAVKEAQDQELLDFTALANWWKWLLILSCRHLLIQDASKVFRTVLQICTRIFELCRSGSRKAY